MTETQRCPKCGRSMVSGSSCAACGQTAPYLENDRFLRLRLSLLLVPAAVVLFLAGVIAMYMKKKVALKGLEDWLYLLGNKTSEFVVYGVVAGLALMLTGAFYLAQARSPKRVHEARLALAELLLFPLLALDGLMCWWLQSWTLGITESYLLNPFQQHYLLVSSWGISCLAVDLLIVGWCWRQVNPAPAAPGARRRRWLLPIAIVLAVMGMAGTVAGFFFFNPKGLYPEIELARLKFPVATENLDTPQKVMDAFLWCSVVGDLDGLSELFWVPGDADRHRLKRHLRQRAQYRLRILQDLRPLADYPGCYVFSYAQENLVYRPRFKRVAGRHYLLDASLADLGIAIEPSTPETLPPPPPFPCAEFRLDKLAGDASPQRYPENRDHLFGLWTASLANGDLLLCWFRPGGRLEQFVLGKDDAPEGVGKLSFTAIRQKSRYTVAHPGELVRVSAGPGAEVAVFCPSSPGMKSQPPQPCPAPLPPAMVDWQAISRSRFQVQGETLQWQLPSGGAPVVLHKAPWPPKQRSRPAVFPLLCHPRSLGVSWNLLGRSCLAPLTLELFLGDDDDGKGVMKLLVFNRTAVAVRSLEPYEPRKWEKNPMPSPEWITDRHGKSMVRYREPPPARFACPGLSREFLAGNRQAAGDPASVDCEWFQSLITEEHRDAKTILRWPGSLKRLQASIQVKLLKMPDYGYPQSFFWQEVPYYKDDGMIHPCGSISFSIDRGCYCFSVRHDEATPVTWEALWNDHDEAIPSWADLKISLALNGKPLRLPSPGGEWYAPPFPPSETRRGTLVVPPLPAEKKRPGVIYGNVYSRFFPIEYLLNGLELPDLDIVLDHLTCRLSFATPRLIEPKPWIGQRVHWPEQGTIVRDDYPVPRRFSSSWVHLPMPLRSQAELDAFFERQRLREQQRGKEEAAAAAKKPKTEVNSP